MARGPERFAARWRGATASGSSMLRRTLQTCREKGDEVGDGACHALHEVGRALDACLHLV